MIDFGGGGGGGCQSFELTTGLWTHSKKNINSDRLGKKKIKEWNIAATYRKSAWWRNSFQLSLTSEISKDNTS